MPAILILPGLFNSGPGHWQTLWEASLPGASRVMQRDWNAPRREEWVRALDQAIRSAEDDVLLAAHSLGCATAVWWAAHHGAEAHARKVKGALLVAPPDVERDALTRFAQGFAPMPTHRLPFPAILVASSDDPWCSIGRARSWAGDWGAVFRDLGTRGHINADSGLGAWAQGQAWLFELPRGPAARQA